MHHRLRSTLFPVLALACLATHSIQALGQQENNTLQVLILNSYDESTAPYFQVRHAFTLELQRNRKTPIAFTQFDLEQRNPTGLVSEKLKVGLLREWAGTQPPDLVMALGPPAVEFWLQNRDALFPEVPLFASAAEFALDRDRFRPGDVVVPTRFTFEKLVGGILRVMPETRHVLIVFGASNHERRLSAAAQAQLQGAFDGLSLEYTNDLAVPELQDRLASLGPGSVVFYGIFDSDVNGVRMPRYAGLSLVREASKVPVFGPFDDQLGQGILGGRLIPLEQTGLAMARLAEELLHQRPLDVTWQVIDLSKPVYDWRELKAWGIAPDRLPQDSTIRFKPPALWEQYARWIILATLLFALLMVLIASLLLQRRRLQRAESMGTDLRSRLITAQEDERRLIARELHDDLSQRLARLAIDASFVASRPDSPGAKEVLQGLQPELVRISKDVHDLSYRLHPSLLEDLGLADALRAECERLGRHSKAVISVRIKDFAQKFPRDTSLCIYRIGQEALQNAVKHSGADRIEISLESVDRALLLSVRDNGCGFDAGDRPPGPSLGLSSMRERARLAGGSLDIRSRPGEGTTVSISVPWPGVPA